MQGPYMENLTIRLHRVHINKKKIEEVGGTKLIKRQVKVVIASTVVQESTMDSSAALIAMLICVLIGPFLFVEVSFILFILVASQSVI
jgi:hypothetical protein